VLTQIIKSVIRTIERGEFRLNYFAESGGMPSVHAAFVVSFTTLAWLNEGWSSPLFALAAVLSVVVAYDSIKVRYATGEQSEALNALINEKKSKVKPVEVIRGHRLVEVLVGAAIGAAVAFVVFFTI
jgi:acid phosphatase family membrane protein YuiD